MRAGYKRSVQNITSDECLQGMFTSLGALRSNRRGIPHYQYRPPRMAYEARHNGWPPLRERNSPLLIPYEPEESAKAKKNISGSGRTPITRGLFILELSARLGRCSLSEPQSWRRRLERVVERLRGEPPCPQEPLGILLSHVLLEVS